MTNSAVDPAIRRLADGGIVVVVDDENRESEGDLIMAAAHATPDRVAFFLEYTSGLLRVAIPPERARRLDLDLMDRNTERPRTAFGVSVDYLPGTTNGISARDRSATIMAMAAESTAPADLGRPGHVFPLLAKEPGGSARPGHAEAGVDLCRLAGARPAALLGELVTRDRLDMMRLPEIRTFAAEHDLPLVTIADLVRDRRLAGVPVRRAAQAPIPTAFGTFRAIAYRSTVDRTEHLALVLGDVGDGSEVLVRVHGECLIGDVAGSLRCDCGGQVDLAMQRIAEAGRGVLVYLRGHDGHGTGLAHKPRAGRQLDTVDGERRPGPGYDSAAHILHDLGARRVRLMTNNPANCDALRGSGIEVVGAVGHRSQAAAHNIGYLADKRDRREHRTQNPPPEQRIA